MGDQAFSLHRWESEFSLDPALLYLNHAAVAPWPRRTAAAVAEFAKENATRGATDYPRWLGTELRLKQQLANLLNAPSIDDVALVKNTSEALSFVAAGLPWKTGDRIVTSDEEFPSNRIVWEALATKFGVEVVRVTLAGQEDPEAALIAACNERTQLLAISSVQYASGLRLDLQRLGQFCSEADIWFCVDAIQSVGAVTFDVTASQIDFAMADGHKWLLGPEGLGFFYTTPAARNALSLFEYGWHMVEHVGDYDRLDWTPARSARRFECGSPNMVGTYGLAASVKLLLEFGIENIARTNIENSLYLIDILETTPKVKAISRKNPSALAGIVTFKIEGVDHGKLRERLQQRGLVCAYRGGGIRFSPDFYQGKEMLDRAVRLLAEEAGL
ncbi:MAG: aminotransferase class V-fold PLP-dependent enzyme [Gammaproteobacteria bacterium]|nr:aminotransferase class V-fold PLP-dependent enzyme [Gammaproteobacteria bacterium]